MSHLAASLAKSTVTLAASAVALAAVIALAPSVASAEPYDGDARWSVGARLSGANVVAAEATRAGDEAEVALAGGGLYGRYRISRRWELELGIDGLSGELDAGLRRDLAVVSVSGLVHMRPDHQWDWYLMAGIGSAMDAVRVADSDDAIDDQEAAYGAVGVGLERRYTRVTLGVELRLFAMSGAPADADDGDADDGDVPAADVMSEVATSAGGIATESSGAQLALSVAYSF